MERGQADQRANRILPEETIQITTITFHLICKLFLNIFQDLSNEGRLYRVPPLPNLPCKFRHLKILTKNLNKRAKDKRIQQDSSWEEHQNENPKHIVHQLIFEAIFQCQLSPSVQQHNGKSKPVCPIHQ